MTYEDMARQIGVPEDDPDMEPIRSVDRFFRAAVKDDES